jgi:CheY-like chemotaxis protein
MDAPTRPTSVLAVDDNPDILMAVESHLMTLDYEVETATSAPEALNHIRNGNVPTVLFSDIVMPGAIDGIELAKIVRQQYPQVGILLMTGWSYDDAHGFPVLTKPFQLVQLTDWIGRFLSGTAR